LPAPVRDALTEAIVSLDAARIRAAVASVADVNSALGAALAQRAGRLHYTLALQSLQLGRGDSLNGEAPNG
jgi:hypothetical protein